MSRSAALLLVVVLSAAVCLAQLEGAGAGRGAPPERQEPPRSDRPANVSSSKDTQVDLSPPENDFEHPGADPGDLEVGEFKKYDPHRAEKDLEVGDYYYKQGNYKAALMRYHDALEYKPNDPVATFKLASVSEKLDLLREASRYYILYLRLQPDGANAGEARKALARLRRSIAEEETSPEKKRAIALVDEGTRLLGRDRYREAIAALRQAAQLDPRNVDAAFFLAEAYEKNGQFDEARAQYIAYLRLDREGIFANAARVALAHLPQLRGEGIPAKPELPTSLPSETPP